MDRAHARGAVRAHPRSRGENAPSGRRLDRPSGSSPLTRGKLGLATHAEVPTGLIPAHAGKTRSWARRARARTAHPRSRGENVPREVGEQRGWGSSPLTRGKREGGHPGAARVRLIPAHAGKTWSSRKVARPIRAHPRSRGENAPGVQAGTPQAGSSPLTRGKLQWAGMSWNTRGLIPAHAGKTRRRNRRPGSPRAHPRSRGENSHRF